MDWIRQHPVWSGVIGLFALVLIVGAISSPTTHTPAGKPAAHSAAAPARQAPATEPSTPKAKPYPSGGPTCVQQFITWRDNGGLKNSREIATDLGTIGNDAQAFGADLSTGAGTQTVSNKLYSDSAALLAVTTLVTTEMPPTCVPNLSKDYGNAISDEQKTAILFQESVTAYNEGNPVSALADIQAANEEISAASTATTSTVNDMTAFNNSNGSNSGGTF